jgi:putative transposase
LQELGITKSTFYKRPPPWWYSKYLDEGYDGLLNKKKASNRQSNSIPQQQKDLVVQVALDRTDLSSRELAHHITDEQQIFISESSVYRILTERGLVSAPAPYLNNGIGSIQR